MTAIYNVTIELVGKENHFLVTWHSPGNNSKDCFTQEAEITPEETRGLWQNPEHQAVIGEKLFRFLDGDARHLARALKEANLQGEVLQVYLRTCKETADWPFELLARQGTFLLPKEMHLVRWVSDWGRGKPMPPQNRQLKFLFMACSALGVKPELDYEEEEDAIFKATESLPIEMEVEDSGSLEGLRRRLEVAQPDVVHLSGHADITSNGKPFFIMEDELGYKQEVFPKELWNDALIENAPRLLFLSGCRTGEILQNHESTDAVSFAHLLVENYNVPAVLGWGRRVNDHQAILAEKALFHGLSQGKSILEAVQRVRYELYENFPPGKKNAWPLLRLFSGGVALNAIVTKGQRWQPKPRQMKRVTLKNSRVPVLAEGFIGRRRQMQLAFRSLKKDYNKVGVLLLGTAGLGKSCLAARICERYTDHTEIIVQGKLDAISLTAALKDAFIISQDTKGSTILAQPGEMKDKLAKLCAGSFKENSYLILLDGFDHNMEGAEKSLPGLLNPEAVELLKVLLHFLPFGGKMTQLIITSRYGFSLTEQGRDLVEERLEKVMLTSFQEPEQLKKLRHLENILRYNYGWSAMQLMREGKGNPLLMEISDRVVARMPSAAEPQLLQAIKEEREKFLRDHAIRELLQQASRELKTFLCVLSAYNQPVLWQDIENKAVKAGITNGQELLAKGIGLGLIEHDQAHLRCQVTPLLREELHTGTPTGKSPVKKSKKVKKQSKGKAAVEITPHENPFWEEGEDIEIVDSEPTVLITKSKKKIITIQVHLERSGDIFHLEVSKDVRAAEIKNRLLDRLKLPRFLEEQPVVYYLHSKTRDKTMDDDKTLRENGVQSNEMFVILQETDGV